MSERLREVLHLPRTTGECDSGPLFEGGFGEVQVRYDVEGEEGPVWTTIRFRGAVAVRTTPDVAVSRYMLEAFSRVCEVEGSSWVEELREAGAKAGGNYGESLRHFVVYFDHEGCIEVAAQSASLMEVPGE